MRPTQRARPAVVAVAHGSTLGSGRLEREAELAAIQVGKARAAGAGGRAADAAANTGAVRQRSASDDGRSLGPDERAYFEPRFGYSFSDVRIHTGARAVRAADALAAQAFTVGTDIVFGRDMYRPSQGAGRHLLAHELAHVIQQGAAAPLANRDVPAPIALSPVGGGPSVQRRPVPTTTVAGLSLGQLAVMPPEYVAPTDDPPGARTLSLFHAVGPMHPLTATTEAVPGDDRAGDFPGFTAWHQAQSFAIHQPEITMVVSDPDPRFHVLNVSGAPRTPNPVHSRRLTHDLGNGLAISHAVNPHLRVATRDPSWAARESHARWLRRQFLTGSRAGDPALWAQLRRAYIVLAVDACGVTPDRIHVQASAGEVPRPGMININVFSEGGSAPSGMSGPSPLAPGLPRARQAQWFYINWQRFRAGRDAVRSTYRHESIHLGTRERVLTLIEQWQRAGQPTGTLRAWLEAQRRLPQGGLARVTERDLHLARAHLRGRRSDESLTAAMTFMTIFHATPADQIDPGVTFGQMRYMLTNWWRIRDLPDFRRHIMDSLGRYYRQRLDPPHRAAFDAWVDRRTSSRSGTDSSEVAEALGQMRAFRGGA